MCGINGQFSYHYAASAVSADVVQRVRDAMRLRGPDGVGYWQSQDRRVALAHRRLAIIDLDPRADQPMHSADARLHVVFNGEIYNYKQLRLQLEAKGAVFRTESDTEVILHGFGAWGLSGMLPKLRGMFAFALFDQQEKCLFLARDLYGIKPLYFADDGWSLQFASSVRALGQAEGVDLGLEPAAQVGFYLWASVPEPWTWYRGIKSVPAGHYITVNALGAQAAVPFQSLADHYLAPPEGAQDAVREALLDSVRAHLVADVPVGAFLSAGVDSGTLVALMRQLHAGEIQTCTLRFAEFANTAADEAPWAERIAERYETKHQTLTVDEQDFRALLPGLLQAMDQPSIDGFNSYLVSRVAAQAGLKVALSGVGGDELFAGYSSFTELQRFRRLGLSGRVPLLGVALRQLARLIGGAIGLPPKAPAVLDMAHSWLGAYQVKRGLFMPWELPALLPRDLLRDGLQRLLAQADTAVPKLPAASMVSWLESTRYLKNQLLRDTDWASMAHSLEVRTPLVDSELHRHLAPWVPTFQSGAGKRAMAMAPKSPLPDALVQRPKSGFSTPVAGWLKHDRQFDSWRRFPFLHHERQHWSRRFAVAIADQYAR